jgi:RNA polymerase sigma factor (sigma-70 family)
MASVRTEASVARPGAYFEDEGLGGLPDEQLIDRFLTHEGADAEAAFRAMVVRHGPMVLGVCRHVLNQHQDAEDAFQATFLVLARKAGSIHDRRVLGRWLYEVAYRIAVRAKTNAVRRRTQERQGAEMSVTAPESEAGWNELKPVLHEEVNRLPEKYRTPVVLCYLEGRTNEEVAAMLDWPVGTVKGRLSRARDLLRTRLTRRGLALSAAFLLTSLSRDSVFAEVVPTRLIDSTVRTAMDLVKSSAAPLAADLAEPSSSALTPATGLKVVLVVALLAVIGAAVASAASFFPGSLAIVRLDPTNHWPTLQVPPASAATSCHAPDTSR